MANAHIATYQDAITAISHASHPEDLFSADDDAAGKQYRFLAALVHPDRHADDLDVAQEAFARLSELWHQRKRTGVRDPFVISTKKRTYLVQPYETHRGDLSMLYRATYAEAVPSPSSDPSDPGEIDMEHAVMLKMPRSPKNNDLMLNEAHALKRLRAEGDETFLMYVPELVETFKHRDKARVERQTNVLAVPRQEEWYTLREVIEAYPGGVPGRHLAWMWRRLLVALGLAHRVGIVHGAVIPEHVLIHPEMHGVTLIDWCYSTEVGTKARAIIPAYKTSMAGLSTDPMVMSRGGLKGYYPAEVLEKNPLTEATDIYMASACMLLVGAGNTPMPMRRFAAGSMLHNERMRPHDAWALQAEYDHLLDRLYGPRTYIEFSMPGRP